MRTSKRLLSFFLAVVMIVTTCSVGFAAFAKENNSIWSTQCEADDAFDSLNGLIDELVPGLLMGIDVIGNPYFEKQAKAMGKTAADLTDTEKEKIIDNATLSEILQVLQPLLLNLLGKTSQQDFVDKYFPGNNVKKFDYLITEDTMSFFTLVAICDTFSKDTVPGSNGNVANPLTSDQKKQLADWYDLLMPIASKAVAGDDLIKKYAVNFEDEFFGYEYDEASLYALESFDFGISDEDAAAIEGMYDSYTAQLRANGVGEDVDTIDSFGKIVYYFFGVGQQMLTAGKYYKLYQDAGIKVTFQGTGDFIGMGEEMEYDINKDITPANYGDVIAAASLEPVGLADSDGNIDWEATTMALMGMEPEDLTPEMVALVKSMIYSMALAPYVEEILPSHYKESLAAIAIREGKATSVADFDSQVEATFYGKDAASMTDEELKIMALALNRTNDSGKEAAYADSFFSGKKTEFVTSSLTFSLTMPSEFKGTATAEYFRLLTGYSKNRDYKNALISAFLPNFTSGTRYIVSSDGSYIPDENGLPQINNHNPNLAEIDEFFAAAQDFAYSWVFTNLTGIQGTLKDETSGQNFIVDVLDYAKNIPADASGSGAAQLTDEDKAAIASVDFAGEIGTAVLNFKLNDTVINLLKMELLGQTIEELVNSLLVTPVNLVDALENVWQRLVDSPVGTIVELVPLLLVLVDELVVPIVANGEDDQWNGVIYSVISTGLISKLTVESGSYIGISQIGWDLNELLPDIMHWLFDQENATGIDYYTDETVTMSFIDDEDGQRKTKVYRIAEVDTSDMKHYTVKDADGNQITRVDDGDTATFSYLDVTSTSFDDIKSAYPDAEFTYSFHYDGSVPKLTGIYIADQALKGANITGLGKIFTNLTKNETVGNSLGEVVTELATLFTAALDEFIATPELRNAEKHDNIGQLLGTGLNNIFVALPQLFDIMENLGADKYSIDKDAWTYCYDGKIAPAGDYNDLRNKDLEELKSFAVKPDANKTFDCFARIFVEQWLDAIIGLLNNVIGDGSTNTAFTENLPIVTGLLQSLGGFGEKSVFTDIFNSIFQLKRGDKYSFEFKPAESTGLYGLSADNAFFLITNVKTLVDVITDLIDSINGKNTASLASTASQLAQYTASIQSNDRLAAPYSAPSYTNDELKDVNGVITSLDEMLSSLLSDSSINGYGLDTAGNIASGLVSFLSNYITADDATSLIGLLNDYLYYLDGAGERSADEDGNMVPEQVYTNKNLTDLVVRTFALIESIAESLLAKFNYSNTDTSYNLIVKAIEGIISPDAIGIRLDDYSGVQKKVLDLDCWSDAIGADGKVNVSLNWGIKAGDNKAFFEGLSSALRLVTTILGVVIVDTGWYDTIVAPVLSALCEPNGVKVDTPSKTATYRDDIIICLLESVTGFLNKLLAAPATTLLNSLKGIAGILDDNSGATLASIVSGALTPLSDELNGVVTILSMKSSKLGAVSLTLANVVSGLADKLDFYATVENNVLVNITSREIQLCGNNLIDIVNKYLGDVSTIVLKNLDWSAISNAKTPAHVLAYIISYVVDMVVDNDNLPAIVALIVGDKEVSDTVTTIIDAIQDGKIDGKGIVSILAKVLKLANSPGVFAWTFEHYLQEKLENFSYPVGLTKTQADEAVQDIDAVINNVFPLLSSLGIDLGGKDIKSILTKNLYTNELLTTIAKALYGALSSNETVAKVLAILGIPCSTADVATILTDKSFGATYTSAAKSIMAASTWDKVDKVNWGFTNGSKNAQQGFVNALAAILRPVNHILAVFLASGTISIDVDKITDLLKSVIGSDPIYLKITDNNFAQLTLSLDGTALTIEVVPTDADHKALKGGEKSTIVLDLGALNALEIYGANGYNSAIIPLLEAFQCKGIVSDATYRKDIDKAKDNLLLDILNPILGGKSSSLINKIAAKPLETITTLLPNIAVFIDGHGVSQLVANILAPITSVVEDVADLVDVEAIVAALMGAPEGTKLGDAIGSLIGLPEGTLTVDLTDLDSINLEDAIIPLVNSLLGGKLGMTLPEIDWNVLASLGTRTTYTSLATDVDGKALTGKKLTDVDYGKTLITVLRYVLNVVLTNVDAIENLVLGIDAIASNDMLNKIVANVFGQLKTHTADQIIVAIYYFFVGDPTDALWDYTGYKTAKSKFKMPEGVTQEDVDRLIAFIDGIVEEINLNVLLKQYLYTNDIINLLAGLIYGNLGDLKINDSIKVNDLLSIVGIDISTKAVASVLGDKSYGETKQFKSATSKIKAAKNWSKVNFDKLDWGVKDQETFLNALVAILRPFYGVLDVVIADGKLNILEGVHIPGSNGYVSTIVPLLEAFECEGIKSYDKYLADKAKTKDALLLDILKPLFGFVDDVVKNPIDTIASVLPNVALFIGNNGIIQLVENLITPIVAIVNDVNPVIDVDKLLQDLTGMEDLSVNKLGDFLADFIGADKIIPLVNSLLTKLGIELPEIDWLQLAALGTVKDGKSAVDCIGKRKIVEGNSGKVIIALLRYVLNTVLSNGDAIKGLLGDAYKGTLKNILDMVFDLDADGLISLVFRLLDLTQSETEVYWTYKHYKQVNSKFTYPTGITAADATKAVSQLDDAVSGIFAILGGLGVLDSSSLSGLVNGLLFKNEMITKLAKTLYGALDSEKLGPYLTMAGIAVSTEDVAKILTDKSYGKTYSSAAKAIKAAKSWDKVGDVNWGFTDGAANAEQGFVNALVAVLRPVLNILGPFLNGTDLELGTILYNVICGLDIQSGDKKKGETLVSFKDGKLTIKSQSNGKYETVLALNFANLDTLKELKLYGSNAYESAIIPLLDVLQVENSKIKSYDQYVKDCKKATDNVLLDILNPLMSFIDRVLEAPFDTITAVLPNLAYFIDNNGVSQLLDNVLSPVTSFLKDAKKDGIDVDEIVELIAGKDLGKLITDLVGLKGVKLNLQLTDLKSCNIQEIVLPLINTLIGKLGIQLPEFKWSTIASHGKSVTSESVALNAEGEYTNEEIIADQGEVLVAVLRYVADLLIQNADALKDILCGIDAIKKNDTISSVIKAVFDSIGATDKDSVVRAVFYLLATTPTNVFWAYKDYKSVQTNFSYPTGNDVTASTSTNAVAQLDDAIGGVFSLLSGLGVVNASDLTGLVNDLLFKDEIITKLAKTLYGALDSEKLGPYLAMAGIPVSTADVAKILVDKSYGKSFTSAAKAIKAAKSWDKVGNVNWGVKDEQTFINALVAVVRPVIKLIAPLLNGSNLELGTILYNVVVGLGRQELSKDQADALKELRFYGANAYESAIIPLLDVLQVENSEIKSYDQYVKDCEKATDNVLLDIINPLMSFIDKVLEAPFDTITAVLPNLAYFIDNNGIGQLLDNLLSPITCLLREAKKDIIDVDALLATVLGKDLSTLITDLVGLKGVKFNLDLNDLSSCNIQEIVVPLINALLSKLGIQLPDFKWSTIASHGKAVTSKSKALNAEGTYTNKEIIADQGEVLIAVLRYVADTLIKNAKAIKDLLCGIEAIKKNNMISSIIESVFATIGASSKDDIIHAIFYFLVGTPRNAFWDYTSYKTGEYTFAYPESVDTDFLVKLSPMLDGLIGGLADLNSLIGGLLFKDELISKLATALYGAIEGVKIGDSNLTKLLAQTGIDFSTANVAKLLTDPAYGKTFEGPAAVIKSAGSWKSINPESLKWGVTDRDSFFHALVAVLRPIYGVLDVLLNDAYLGLFDIVKVPGSDGYTSSIVPLMEAFSMYNIKTQYQYREDIKGEYDCLLLDIINPLWDKVEDIFNAPLQTVASMLPNLALFIGNDGLCQIIDNLLTPISALADAIKPVVNLNDLVSAVLSALKVDLGSILGKIGVTNFKLDLYDLKATLQPILGGDAIIPLVNGVLGIIKIKGQPLGLKLNDVDWLQLASHGKTIVAASQAATFGSRVYVEGDPSETLIAVLRYLIDTVNTGDNFDKIVGLIGGLLGDKLSDSISDVINQVLGMLQGDTDDVIASLVDLLQTLA